MAVDSDRDEILEALRAHHEAVRAEFARHEETIVSMRGEVYDLLARGRTAGIGRKAMSKAGGLTLPSLSRLLDGSAD